MAVKTGYINLFFQILLAWHHGGNVKVICETIQTILLSQIN